MGPNAPGAKPACGPERKKLIIDWTIGVAWAPSEGAEPTGPHRRAGKAAVAAGRHGLTYGREGAGGPRLTGTMPRAAEAAEWEPEPERCIDALRARLRLPGQLAGREWGGRGGASPGLCGASLAGSGIGRTRGPLDAAAPGARAGAAGLSWARARQGGRAAPAPWDWPPERPGLGAWPLPFPLPP